MAEGVVGDAGRECLSEGEQAGLAGRHGLPGAVVAAHQAGQTRVMPPTPAVTGRHATSARGSVEPQGLWTTPAAADP